MTNPEEALRTAMADAVTKTPAVSDVFVIEELAALDREAPRRKP